MILVCPQCRTGFQVPDGTVGPQGRRVRCGACAHVWHCAGEDRPPAPADADPGEPAEIEIPVPEAPSVPRSMPARDVAPEPERPAFGAASVPALARRRRPWIALGWAAWGLFMVGLAVAVFGFRARMLAVWPPIGGLYDLVGMAQAVPLPPEILARDVLAVRIDADPSWEATGESWALTVTGTISNRADVEMTLPPLVLHLVGGREQTLRRVRLEPDAPTIAARGSMRFEIRVPDAPAETAGIVHVWEQGE